MDKNKLWEKHSVPVYKKEHGRMMTVYGFYKAIEERDKEIEELKKKIEEIERNKEKEINDAYERGRDTGEEWARNVYGCD